MMEVVMNTRTGSLFRWSLIMGYIGVVSLILSCATLGFGSSKLAKGILQLDEGVVKVQNQNGDWQPLAGESTFELVGNVESTDPWQVAGRTLQTNEATQVAQGLDVGGLVRVRGAALENDTWLAYSIEPAEEDTDQTISIIGRVTSVDPWVVNDITLNVTGDTVITGDIKPGTLVKVEILLLEDGTWEVISISPLGDLTPSNGCVNVIATVVSVSGSQVQFLGWPTPLTVDKTQKTDDDNNSNENDNDASNENDDDDENNNENDNDENDDLAALQPGQQVLAVICPSADGQLVIVKITVLDDDDDGDTGTGGEKVLVCHKPDKKGGHTISIASPAVPAHLAHGDRLGACPSGK
jgi:hypothetical protein